MSRSFSIFFDIDRTIFDTQQFVELIEKMLSKLIGVNLKKIGSSSWRKIAASIASDSDR